MRNGFALNVAIGLYSRRKPSLGIGCVRFATARYRQNALGLAGRTERADAATASESFTELHMPLAFITPAPKSRLENKIQLDATHAPYFRVPFGAGSSHASRVMCVAQ